MIQIARLPAARRDRNVERAAQSRLLLAHERALEARVAQIVAQLGRQAAQAHRHGEDITPVVAAYARSLRDAIRASLTATALDFGHRLMTAPKAAHAWEAKAFEDLDSAIARHMTQHAAEAVVGISESTRAAIARVVAGGIAENLGQEEIAARIVEATSGEIAMARARRIARTEVHFAAMYGQQQAAEASPLAFDKEWLATEDARTRKHHAEAHGQRVPLTASFAVGDVRLRYPGDTAGPPGEIINCRCVCLYEPLPYPKGEEPRPEVVQRAPQQDQDGAEQVDDTPSGSPAVVQPDLVTDRDLEARPHERPAVTLYAAGALLSLDDDSTPRVGDVRHLVGPADLYLSPDAPEIDRQIASNPGGLFTRRPILWQITIPAGPWLPEKLVEVAGAGWVIASGVGRFGLVPLTVRRVRKMRWGEIAPKGPVDPFARFTEDALRWIERQLARIEDAPAQPDDVARRLAAALERDAGDASTIADLVDRDWTTESLLHYLAGLVAEDLSPYARAAVTAALHRLESPAVADGAVRADEIAQSIAVYLLGERQLEEGARTPGFVLRDLADTRWTKPTLARYLRRLLDGDLQDQPEPGEPPVDARVIVVEAEADILAAVPEGYQDETNP